MTASQHSSFGGRLTPRPLYNIKPSCSIKSSCRVFYPVPCEVVKKHVHLTSIRLLWLFWVLPRHRAPGLHTVFVHVWVWPLLFRVVSPAGAGFDRSWPNNGIDGDVLGGFFYKGLHLCSLSVTTLFIGWKSLWCHAVSDFWTSGFRKKDSYTHFPLKCVLVQELMLGQGICKTLSELPHDLCIYIYIYIYILGLSICLHFCRTGQLFFWTCKMYMAYIVYY